MAKDAKLIRGQLRQIVKEELSNILTQELVAAVRKQLEEEVRATMKPLDADVRSSVEALNRRYLELNSHIITALSNQMPLPTPEPTSPPDSL